MLLVPVTEKEEKGGKKPMRMLKIEIKIKNKDTVVDTL